jgi:hypothetical protein
LFIILSLACGLASATTIVADIDPTRGLGDLWFDESGTPVGAYFVGVLKITLVDPTGTYHRDTLCVDLFTNINVSQTYGTDIAKPSWVSGRGDLDRVSWLIDNALLPTETSITTTAIPQDKWVRTPEQGAAIQLAIWDIVVDGGDGLLPGAGRVTQSTDPSHPSLQAVLDLVNYYEQVSAGKTSDLAFVYETYSLGDHGPVGTPAQMLEGPEFPDGPQPEPEPSTFALGVPGLLAAAYLAHRKKTGY